MGLFGGGILGGLVGGLTGGKKTYGSKPKVPDTEQEYQKAIQTNINLIPQLSQLAAQYNQLSQQAMNKQYEQAIPGFEETLGQLREFGQEGLKGRYPADLQKAIEDQVTRSVAASTFKGGYGGLGSPFGVGRLAAERTNIPQNAVQLGMAALDRWAAIGRQRLGSSLNLGSFMLSGQEQFNRDWQQNVINAAPNPVTRGQFDTSMGIIGMALGAYSGGSYQNTYRPQYSQAPLGTQRPPPYSQSYPVTPLPQMQQPYDENAVGQAYNFGQF